MTRHREKTFLDTNILVYTFDASAPAKREIARAILAAGLESKTAVISYQVIQEFLNVATRKFVKPMNVPEAHLYLSQVLLRLCDVFPDGALYSRAVSISGEAQISFYDALIVASALEAGCTLLLSEDLQDGRRLSGLEIRNPFRSLRD